MSVSWAQHIFHLLSGSIFSCHVSLLRNFITPFGVYSCSYVTAQVSKKWKITLTYYSSKYFRSSEPIFPKYWCASRIKKKSYFCDIPVFMFYCWKIIHNVLCPCASSYLIFSSWDTEPKIDFFSLLNTYYRLSSLV